MALIGRLIGPLLDGHFFAVEIPSRIIWMPSGGSVGVTTLPPSIPSLWLPSWLLASVPGEE